MRVNGNLRGLAWAAAGGAIYDPTQKAAVPGARGAGWGGSPVYMPPNLPVSAPMVAPSPQIRPVALGPAARPSPPAVLPGASLGPSSSAPAAVVTAPVTDGTATALIQPSAPASAPSAIPWALIATLILGSQ